jgi:hypothetical protein
MCHVLSSLLNSKMCWMSIAKEVFWDTKKWALTIPSVQATGQVLSSSKRASNSLGSKPIWKNHTISPLHSVHSISKLFTIIMLLILIVWQCGLTCLVQDRQTVLLLANMTMKNAVFWDVAPCSPFVNRRFGGTYRLHLQGRKICERGTSMNRWLQTERQSKTTSYIRTGREGEWATWEINSERGGQTSWRWASR